MGRGNSRGGGGEQDRLLERRAGRPARHDPERAAQQLGQRGLVGGSTLGLTHHRLVPVEPERREVGELARLVLSHEQQRIEMTNLQAAWEGATDFSPLTPVMTREQLLKALVLLAPDMPNLLNHKGPFYPDDLTQDVPGGKPQKSSVTAPVATAGKQPVAEEKKAVESTKGSGMPKYRGVLYLIYMLGPIEALLFDLACRHDQTLVLVTHDPDLAKRSDRSLVLHEGRLDPA